MRLDDATANCVRVTPRWLGKRILAKSLCAIGFHHDDWYVSEQHQSFSQRPGTQWFARPVNRIFRYCGRCGSIR